MRGRFTGAVLAGLVLVQGAAGPVSAQSAAGGQPPNIVFILTDDLGYMDIEPNNPRTFYETPNLSAFARTAVRFTQGYVANPICSPSRYSVMTGRYPTRGQATDWFHARGRDNRKGGAFLPAEIKHQMEPSETTIAEALKARGYKTAFVGKWHLGPSERYWPKAQGFDINIGGSGAGNPGKAGYFSPYGLSNLKDGPAGEYLTDRLTDEAIKIIKTSEKKPLFLFLSYYSPHIPLEAPQELIAKYEARKGEAQFTRVDDGRMQGKRKRRSQSHVRVNQTHPVYAAMVERLDANIGRVLKAIDERGGADNTLVVFTSDNGGLSTGRGMPTSNYPLYGGKGWISEGGIRVPVLIRTPSRAQAGQSVDVPVTSTDYFATLADYAGTGSPAYQDGVSLKSVLETGQGSNERPLFWHYPHYSAAGGFPGGAVRQGNLKLIERYEDGSVFLYDLMADPGETNDLSAERPGDAARLRALLHAWYKDTGATFLRADPQDPASAHPWSDRLAN